MPNPTVPADAEGVPKDQPHTLIELIDAYHAGLQAYRDAPSLGGVENERAFCQQAYGWALDALEAWKQSAPSQEAAIAALRLAKQDCTDFDSSRLAVPMITAALGYLETLPAHSPTDPWQRAEHHARELAKAMAPWPESMRFSVTIHPHDAEQRLFWLSAPLPADEAAALSACIDVHRAALKAFADVTETEGESYAAADEAESQAFTNILAFRCRWTESKETKARYLLGLLRQPCAAQLDADQLEVLLESLT